MQSICSVDTCTSKRHAGGFCSKHYDRWKKYGDPHFVKITRDPDIEARFRHHGWTVTEAGCWEWGGSRSDEGYARICLGGRETNVSRVMYGLRVGPIPEGHLIRHKCDNPPCVNPDHLETGTNQDNANDKVRRGRSGIKLHAADIAVIRAAHAAGTSQHALADVYGVHQSTISDIITGRRWAHVASPA